MLWLDIVQEVYDMCIIGNSSSQKSIKQETVDKSGVCNILNEKRRLFQTNYWDSIEILPAKQSIPFARAMITRTRTITIMTIITIIPTVNEFESGAEMK